MQWFETYTKLDGHGEEIATCFLRNYVSSRNTWKIDIGALYNAFGALGSLENLFGESEID